MSLKPAELTTTLKHPGVLVAPRLIVGPADTMTHPGVAATSSGMTAANVNPPILSPANLTSRFAYSLLVL